MNIAQAEKISAIALKWGLVLVGALCFYGAIDQIKKGWTYGLTGKGRVESKDEPGYFLMLFIGRIILGAVCLAGGLWSLTR